MRAHSRSFRDGIITLGGDATMSCASGKSLGVRMFFERVRLATESACRFARVSYAATSHPAVECSLAIAVQSPLSMRAH